MGVRENMSEVHVFDAHFWCKGTQYPNYSRSSIQRAQFPSAVHLSKQFVPEHAFLVLPLNPKAGASAARPSVTDFLWDGEANAVS